MRQLPTQIDLPAVEREVLRRWRAGRVFQRSLEQTAAGPPWVFYEGPPTANGMPGVHHVEARVFKDLFPRFKTMKGFHVPRRAGWDCHGLPVEVAVERELGLSGKRDIERYGVAAFNARCRESVLRHVDAFEQLTDRMGYWVDMSEAYRTMDAQYIESVWWSLKVIFDAGLLVRDYRISPYCPRCGTPLSDHELGQPGGYETVVDPSVIVRLPVTSGPLAGEADLLVWTTTPWTLVANTAVAVHPDVTYVVARKAGEGDRVVVAEPLRARVLGEGWHAVRRLTGTELAGAGYRRPFNLVDVPSMRHEPGGASAPAQTGGRPYQVLAADFVTVDEGTGLVHLAPAFGADDLAACRAAGLPVVNPLQRDGRFYDSIRLVGGLFFKDADRRLLERLDERGLLFRSQVYEHSYPHCWRCHSPLLYYALPTWFVTTTAVKERLLEQNRATSWYPESVKWGRYGEWLANNVDWALSRNRYWGTPLPLWVCRHGHVTCVGSLTELGELAGRDLSWLDPHRPYLDEVTFACRHRRGAPAEVSTTGPATEPTTQPPTQRSAGPATGPASEPPAACGARAQRVSEVIDAWYDAGAMPFAQFGAPYRAAAEFERSHPAQFVCEAIDQTRGWFYALMAVGTLVLGRSPYENAVVLGHIVADDGRKMSKHLGNVLEPIPLMERHGADALRWFMAASGSPWSARRVGNAAIEEVVRKVLLTYWNTASFLVLYAGAAGPGGGGEPWTPDRRGEAPAPAERPPLDRWVLAELHDAVRVVDDALERFDPVAAGRRLTAFIDDLSNWYVRRSRRRFWAGPGDAGGAAAFATLYECLETLTRLMAPFTPFVTDYVWDVIRPAGTPDSVHLAAWPRADEALLDPALVARMRLVRRLVELGRAARGEAGVRTRQPLARALVGAAGWADLPAELRAEVAEELNVAAIADLAGLGDDLVDYEVKPNFRTLGAAYGRQTPHIAAAIGAADPAELVAALRAGGSVRLEVADAGSVTLGPDHLVVTERPRTGWAVRSAGGETVALDLGLTDELRRAGLTREAVRLIQEARKAAALAVSDRIEVWWHADSPELAQALREGGAEVAAEVLAAGWSEDRPPDGLTAHRDGGLALTFWLRRVP